jgi:hypothetical protein
MRLGTGGWMGTHDGSIELCRPAQRHKIPKSWMNTRKHRHMPLSTSRAMPRIQRQRVKGVCSATFTAVCGMLSSIADCPSVLDDRAWHLRRSWLSVGRVGLLWSVDSQSNTVAGHCLLLSCLIVQIVLFKWPLRSLKCLRRLLGRIRYRPSSRHLSCLGIPLSKIESTNVKDSNKYRVWCSATVHEQRHLADNGCLFSGHVAPDSPLSCLSMQSLSGLRPRGFCHPANRFLYPVESCCLSGISLIQHLSLTTCVLQAQQRRIDLSPMLMCSFLNAAMSLRNIARMVRNFTTVVESF